MVFVLLCVLSLSGEMEDDVDGSLIRALGGLRSPAAAGLQPLFGGDSPNGQSLSPKGG